MSDALVCLEMGNVFQEEGNYAAAADAYQRAVAIDPGFARNYFCLGNLYRKVQQLPEALRHYNEAIRLDPKQADFYNNRGLLHYEIGNPAQSEVDFLRAIELNPQECYFYNNLGVLYQCINQLEKAKSYFETAIQIDPTYISSHLNLGVVYSALGDQMKAIALYDEVIRLDPQYAEGYNSKCLSLLLMGRYEEGWNLQEWRWKTNYKPFRHGLPEGILWDGIEPLVGKTILIESEQGLGDTIQFCRYLPLLEKLGAKIVFRTEKALISLMQSLPVKMQVIAKDQTPVATDYYLPLLTLPLIFRTTLNNIPSHSPYLFSEPTKFLAWQSRIQKIDKKLLKVGLVWAGAQRPQELRYRGLNSRRDIPLSLLEPLFKEDIQLFSLQKGDSAKRELQDLNPALQEKLIDWSDDLEDFSNTAALIDNLDVIVCVDTSTAHLAGALGKPVFLLNRKDTCWRWLEKGSSSPWYSSLTVFRQSEFLQWNSVVQEVVTALRKLSQVKASV